MTSQDSWGWRIRLAWLGILILAAGLRLYRPDWDGGIAAHPDERFLLDVAQRAPLARSPCAAAPDFPYGTFPITLIQLLAIASPDADSLFAARLLSALVGVLLVVAGGAAGSRVAGPWGGPLAAVLLALVPFPIQQAHFYTVDPFMALLVTVAILAAAQRHWRLAGAMCGLALACKASAVLAWGVLLAMAVREDWQMRSILRVGRAGLAFVFASLLALGLGSPWAMLTPVSCWRGALVQGALVGGRYIVPYTQQYYGTLPLLYPLWQIALGGMGPGVIVAGLGGALFALLRLHSRRLRSRSLYLAWTGLVLLAFGSLWVKFPRYMLPLYPWLAAWAAFGLLRVRNGVERRVAIGLVLSVTGFMGMAQVGVYRTPHPWLTASRWLYERVPERGVVAVEAWEHPLPVPLPEARSYVLYPLSVYEADTPSEVAAVQHTLDQAHVLVIASRRAVNALARQPDRYADLLSLYGKVLAEWEVHVFTRCPVVGPFALTDDPLSDAALPSPGDMLAERCGVRWAIRLPRLDESFRVYDAPLTVVAFNPGVSP